MADIFISYKRENQDAVQRIVQGLRNAGLSVWWDQDIAPDAPWEQTIESELEKAKVVIVAWSEAAVASENVKAEARRARNQGKLIQIYVEPCEPPLFFGERQGVDLSNWNGNAGDNRFQAILTAVRAILAGKRPPEGVGYRPRQRAPWASLTAAFVLVSAVLGFISNLGGARDAVCSLAALNQRCIEWNLITPPAPPPLDPAVLQEALVRSIEGRWSRGDRPDCSIATEFAVARDENDVYRIRSVSPPDWDSTMQVGAIDVERGMVTASTIRPGESGVREQWEFHPNGDLMQVIAPNGTPTPLARCE
ncbi:MAG: hypothetical protein A4S17_05225 [Proteobacteria bacterium HN_bin10]|nr:MAG: hypothetical protein A4S17_05225 [Proteobacteria bacterium HN_bin10]